MRTEIVCMNCAECNVITDDEMCKHLKCMATSKKGRDITWSMCCINGDGTPVNTYRYFADYLENHKRPKWCPKTNK